MSDILASMVSFLQLDAGVSAAVSTRIYPSRIPAGSTSAPTTMPCVTYQLISEPAQSTHDGQSLYEARVQVDCWGSTFKSAHDTAGAVHSALHNYRGSWNSYFIGAIFRKRKQDLSEADAEFYRVSMDFVIHYREE